MCRFNRPEAAQPMATEDTKAQLVYSKGVSSSSSIAGLAACEPRAPWVSLQLVTFRVVYACFMCVCVCVCVGVGVGVGVPS